MLSAATSGFTFHTYSRRCFFSASPSTPMLKPPVLKLTITGLRFFTSSLIAWYTSADHD